MRTRKTFSVLLYANYAVWVAARFLLPMWLDHFIITKVCGCGSTHDVLSWEFLTVRVCAFPLWVGRCEGGKRGRA